MPLLFNNKDKNRPAIAHAIGLGTQLAAGVAVFTGLGYYIDKKTGGGSGWTLVGIFLGLFYGGYEVWKVIRELNRDNESDTSPPKK